MIDIRKLALALGSMLTISVGCAPRAHRILDTSRRPPRAETMGRVQFALCDEGLPLTGMWKCDPVFADVNGDEILDLIAVPRKGNGPHVFIGNGHGAWTDSSRGLDDGRPSCGGGLAVADLNGDDLPDLARADHCHGIFVYLNDGAGGWNLVTTEMFPSDLVVKESERDEYLGSEDIDVGDVNGDGFPDLLAGASDNGGISVYLGNGSGTMWTRQTSNLPTQGVGNRVLFTDVNSDGKLDIVASYAPGPRVWLGDGRGNWTERSAGLPDPMVHGLYRGLAVADFNEDGRMDIAAANWIDGPEVYYQQMDGSWGKSRDVFPQMHGGSVGAANGDFDHDGHMDLVVTGRLTQDVGFVYGVFLLFGDGRGGWTWSRDTGLPETGLSFTWGVTVADINGDSVPDIAAGSGGIVATPSAGPTEPVIAPRLPVWCGRLKTAR